MGNLEFQVGTEKLTDGSSVAVVHVIGSIDGNTVKRFETKTLSFLNEEGFKYLILNFSELKYMNSTGLGILVKVLDKYQEKSGDVKLVNVPKNVADLFEMLGISSILQTKNSNEEALNSLPAPLLPELPQISTEPIAEAEVEAEETEITIPPIAVGIDEGSLNLFGGESATGGILISAEDSQENQESAVADLAMDYLHSAESRTPEPASINEGIDEEIEEISEEIDMSEEEDVSPPPVVPANATDIMLAPPSLKLPTEPLRDLSSSLKETAAIPSLDLGEPLVEQDGDIPSAKPIENLIGKSQTTQNLLESVDDTHYPSTLRDTSANDSQSTQLQASLSIPALASNKQEESEDIPSAQPFDMASEFDLSLESPAAPPQSSPASIFEDQKKPSVDSSIEIPSGQPLRALEEADITPPLRALEEADITPPQPMEKSPTIPPPPMAKAPVPPIDELEGFLESVPSPQPLDMAGESPNIEPVQPPQEKVLEPSPGKASLFDEFDMAALETEQKSVVDEKSLSSPQEEELSEISGELTTAPPVLAGLDPAAPSVTEEEIEELADTTLESSLSPAKPIETEVATREAIADSSRLKKLEASVESEKSAKQESVETVADSPPGFVLKTPADASRKKEESAKAPGDGEPPVPSIEILEVEPEQGGPETPLVPFSAPAPTSQAPTIPAPMEERDEKEEVKKKSKKVMDKPEKGIKVETGTVVEKPKAEPKLEPEPKPIAGPIKRKATIRYYQRINPMKTFPLSATFSKGSLKEAGIENVAQKEAKKSLHVSPQSPDITVTPSIKGCIVYPTSVTVDVTPEIATAKFWVTPVVEGEITGSVELIHEGRSVEKIPLKISSVKRTWAKVSAVAALIFPIISFVLDGLQWDIQRETWSRLPQAIHFVRESVGISAVGGVAALLFIIIGWVLYAKSKPVEAEILEQFFAYQEK